MRWIWILLAMFGCDSGGGGSTVDDAQVADAAVSMDAAPDMAAPDAAEGEDPDAAPIEPDMAVEPPNPCEAFGMPSIEMQAGEGARIGDLVGDFTANTLSGPWNLAERWSGCESYVFVTYFQDLRANPGAGWPGDQLWASDPMALIDEGPRNVHYFFVSYEEQPAARAMRMNALKQQITLGLSFGDYTPEEVEFWGSRLHYVTDRVTEIQGSVGAYATDYMAYLFSPDSRVDLGDRGQAQPPLPMAFGIGRDQRWDPGGSLNPVVGRPPEMAMAAYFGHFYNHRAGVREKVAAEAATVVPLLDELVTDRILVRTVELPPAAEMETFDLLEFDVAIVCHHRNPFGCSEWDRIARIDWCADPECSQRTEVVRWITPYWRRGLRRWVMDASPFLGLMRAGGEQTFRVEMGPGWERGTEREARMSVRLAARGERPKSQVVERAFGGGGFGGEYNNREPFAFTPPADANRVEVVVIVSGHGQTDGDNCAEWCDHRHHLAVDGNDLPVVSSPLEMIGALRGCAVRAVDGVSPGQWGNWAPGRAYWCPGMPVDAIRFDVTEHVEPGVESQLTYRGTLGAATEPRGGDIALNVYVVSYTD